MAPHEPEVSSDAAPQEWNVSKAGMVRSHQDASLKGNTSDRAIAEAEPPNNP